MAAFRQHSAAVSTAGSLYKNRSVRQQISANNNLPIAAKAGIRWPKSAHQVQGTAQAQGLQLTAMELTDKPQPIKALSRPILVRSASSMPCKKLLPRAYGPSDHPLVTHT